MSVQILTGDCREIMKTLPDSSVDSIVTDPPYGLEFMGKAWDKGVPGVEVWRECLRVLKPGGHLLAFAGTRTQHRMCTAIEDAGFEIRDMILYIYGSGFPKSLNLDSQRGKITCACEDRPSDSAESVAEPDLHGMRHDVPSASVACGESQDAKLQQTVQRDTSWRGLGHAWAQGSGSEEDSHATARSGQSGLEGWGNDLQEEGQLQERALLASAGLGSPDGAEGRLPDGTSASDGRVVRLPADADRSSPPRRPQPTTERSREPRIVAGQSQSQARGAWPVCGGCSKPILPKGLGTALKPSCEPITVARKPLVGTVTANVLQHGTGALNVDGCRIDANGEKTGSNGAIGLTAKKGWNANSMSRSVCKEQSTTIGRWPANIIHDGEDAADMLGEASRFFYCAKASKTDRGEGNTHPTVKPTALMRYLVRLVTPPGGTVLDPFAGSGTTLVAADAEGFSAIGIELSPEYVEIIRRRLYGNSPLFAETV